MRKSTPLSIRKTSLKSATLWMQLKTDAFGYARKVLSTGKRIDGRDTKTVRPITCEVGLLPTTHGSALFTRGETQALVVTTLGTAEDSQIIDGLMDEERQEFMLNYNFPPFPLANAAGSVLRGVVKSDTENWHGAPFIR